MENRMLSALVVGVFVTMGGVFLIAMKAGVGSAGPGSIYGASLFFGIIAATLTFIYNREPDQLGRFVQAQEKTYAGALAELTAGRKMGHWIWWIFPQLRGLGTSHNSTFYGLADEDEALDYLQHPVLGQRYRECVAAVHRHLCQDGVRPEVLMGSDIDVLKLRISLELFLQVAPPIEETFREQARDILKTLG
jgi:uncharacterized protein (DUF1810 family)